MRVFEMKETVVYTVALNDEKLSDLRQRMLWSGATDEEVVEEAVARGWIDLLNEDNYVEETVMVGEV